MKNKQTKMDDIDIIIFRELQKNARLTCDELSRRTNISRSTISRRLRRLLENDIIRIIATADVFKMGYTMVGIRLEIEITQIQKAVQKLLKYKEFDSVVITSGKLNVLAVAAFADMTAFQEFMNTVIANLEGVKSVETSFFLEVFKGRFMQEAE